MALDIFHSLPGLGLVPDDHTFSSIIRALAKGKLHGQWEIAWEVGSHPQAHQSWTAATFDTQI